MMGSETFIIVAFMCSENRTSCCFASSISAARNSTSFAFDRYDASTTSPACTDSPSLSTVVEPSVPTSSMRSVSAAGMVTDSSLERKSPSPIVATWLRDSDDHAPIECGFFRAYSLTAFGARRSELPSRSTGFTAEPLTAS
jgi:hypothetical protein